MSNVEDDNNQGEINVNHRNDNDDDMVYQNFILMLIVTIQKNVPTHKLPFGNPVIHFSIN